MNTSNDATLLRYAGFQQMDKGPTTSHERASLRLRLSGRQPGAQCYGVWGAWAALIQWIV